MIERTRLAGLIILSCLLALAAWWLTSAGVVTVYRTIAYNFSGIDDHLIFPQRKLTASPQPFRFSEPDRARSNPVTVSLGNRHNVPLAELLATTDTTAFLVVKNDRILFEQYFAGYERSTPSLSFSMAKSILSILIGCALSDGVIKSVDQPVTDFILELMDKGYASVTLRHLLQMTSGMDYDENDNPFGLHVRFYYTDRLEQEILKLRLSEPPGNRFVYKSGDALLLTLALKRALKGKNITEYMQQRLWHPLGMEYDGSWSIDHAPDGLEKTSCCLAATARDFAKFGRLYLNKGLWGEQRIVPKTWVTESTRMDTSAGSSWQYQHLWWLVAEGRPDFMAAGHLGQFLYVNPATGVIIIRLGKSLGGLTKEEWQQLFISLSD